VATSPQPPDESAQMFSIEYEQEKDGRWLAEVPALPGVVVYGKTKQDAEVAVTALALRVIADPTEQGRKRPAAKQNGSSKLCFE
jgi:predicted RNase H-like HicB family nuclease